MSKTDENDTDDLADGVVADLNQRWPEVSGALVRKPSRSTVGRPLFFLHWTGGPDLGPMRDMLDQVHPQISVMLDRSARAAS